MKRFVLVLFSFAALSAVAAFSGCEGGGNTFSGYDGARSYSVGNGTAGGISSIEIEWVAGSVAVRVSQSATQISFSETSVSQGDSLKLHYRVSGGKLDLKFAASEAKYPAGFSKDLTVTLPASVQLSVLEIETASGSVAVDGVRAREIDVDAEDSSVSVSGCTFSKSEVSTEGGDVTYTLADEGFRCEFDSRRGSVFDEFGAEQSGKIYTYGNGGIEIKVETVSGQLWLKRK